MALSDIDYLSGGDGAIYTNLFSSLTGSSSNKLIPVGFKPKKFIYGSTHYDGNETLVVIYDEDISTNTVYVSKNGTNYTANPIGSGNMVEAVDNSGITIGYPQYVNDTYAYVMAIG